MIETSHGSERAEPLQRERERETEKQRDTEKERKSSLAKHHQPREGTRQEEAELAWNKCGKPKKKKSLRSSTAGSALPVVSRRLFLLVVLELKGVRQGHGFFQCAFLAKTPRLGFALAVDRVAKYNSLLLVIGGNTSE